MTPFAVEIHLIMLYNIQNIVSLYAIWGNSTSLGGILELFPLINNFHFHAIEILTPGIPVLLICNVLLSGHFLKLSICAFHY